MRKTEAEDEGRKKKELRKKEEEKDAVFWEIMKWR